MTARGRPRRRQGRGPASRRSLASTPDACGALKSRASPRSSPRGTPRRQAPAQGRPRCRRERRLRLGVGALRQRDEGVERLALDVVRDAHQRGLDDLRTRCVDGVGRARERAATTAWDLATSSSTCASSSARDGLCRAAPTAPERRGGPSRPRTARFEGLPRLRRY